MCFADLEIEELPVKVRLCANQVMCKSGSLVPRLSPLPLFHIATDGKQGGAWEQDYKSGYVQILVLIDHQLCKILKIKSKSAVCSLNDWLYALLICNSGNCICKFFFLEMRMKPSILFWWVFY